jgi:hypothetical protein
MSHRVTTQTQMNDRVHAAAAFTKAKISHKDLGNGKFSLTAGRSQGVLDIGTGEIVGDGDRWNESDFNVLKQAYAEEVFTSELRRQGATVQSRDVDKEGNIVILYQTTG